MELELWKPIINYEFFYHVSDLGRIKSFHQSEYGHILASGDNGNGYLGVTLCDVGKGKRRFYIHFLVALHFIPNPENKPEVNHKKGNKKDNRASELEWSTRSENMIHAFKTGLRVVTDWQRIATGSSNKLRCSKRVVNISTGEIYDSIADAAFKTGINYHTLKDKISGRKGQRQNAFKLLDSELSPKNKTS